MPLLALRLMISAQLFAFRALQKKRYAGIIQEPPMALSWSPYGPYNSGYLGYIRG